MRYICVMSHLPERIRILYSTWHRKVVPGPQTTWTRFLWAVCQTDILKITKKKKNRWQNQNCLQNNDFVKRYLFVPAAFVYTDRINKYNFKVEGIPTYLPVIYTVCWLRLQNAKILKSPIFRVHFVYFIVTSIRCNGSRTSDVVQTRSSWNLLKSRAIMKYSKYLSRI